MATAIRSKAVLEPVEKKDEDDNKATKAADEKAKATKKVNGENK